jgi:hypothetical protein
MPVVDNAATAQHQPVTLSKTLTRPGATKRDTLVGDFIAYVEQSQSRDGGATSTTGTAENPTVASAASLRRDPESPKPLLNLAQGSGSARTA